MMVLPKEIERKLNLDESIEFMTPLIAGTVGALGETMVASKADLASIRALLTEPKNGFGMSIVDLYKYFF